MDFKWDLVAIDSGGTFTDVIALKGNKISVFKISSTPKSPQNAIHNVISKIENALEIVHGTTIATNAVIENKGAKTILISTKGFKDVIEIGRQNRNNIYELYPSRPKPLVPQNLRFEIDERIGSSGQIIKKLNDNELNLLLSQISKMEPDAIAISLIFSFLNPNHEIQLKNKLTENPNLFISISSEVLPEYREYERTSTTVIDAYLKPLIQNYLTNITNKINSENSCKNISIMKSNSGLANITSILKRPVDTIFSGLAGGFKASEFTSNYLNEPNIISIDIGGTSTDVSSLRNFKGEILNNLKISGHPISRPAVDVQTIGAGGGSIVKYTDGLITIGPESASADPGPISYDKGGMDLTITDINLVMGILPISLAGGEIKLNIDKALSAVDRLSQELNLSIKKTISGVRRIFHENIANAIRSVSTQRGYDPRDFVLLAYGGAGPLHAIEIAEIMSISKIIIPPYPGVWSSFGLMGADYEYYASKSIIKPLKEMDQNYLEDCINNLIQELKNKIQLDDIKVETPKINIFLKLRFIGQSYELKVNYTQFTDIKNSFLSKHKLLYGFAAENEPIEVISIEVNYVIKRKYPSLPNFASNKNEEYDEIKLHDNTIVKKYSKTNLYINKEYKGPIIIQQDDSTIFIPHTWIFHIDNYGFISIFKGSS